MTPDPDDLETLAPNSAAPSPPAPEAQSLQSVIGPGDDLEEELRSKLSQLIGRANSKDGSASEDEGKTRAAGQRTGKESEALKERAETERPRTNGRLKDCSAGWETSERAEQVNGQEVKRSEGLTKSPSMRDEGRIRERKSGGLDRTVDEPEQRRGHKREPNRHSKRQSKRDNERDSEKKRAARRSGSSASSPALTPSSQEGALSDNQVRPPGGSCRLLVSPSNCLETRCDSSSYSPSSLYLCANHSLCLPSDIFLSFLFYFWRDRMVAPFILAAGEILDNARGGVRYMFSFWV